ncbi:MAG: M56 family metallopeptidase, partial [Candidatus Aminicenantaceae bacterium]
MMILIQNPSYAEWILNTAVHSLIILLIAWLIVKIIRHKNTPLKSAVVFMTMLSLLILPFFTIFLSSIELQTFKTEFTVLFSYPDSSEDSSNALLSTSENPHNNYFSNFSKFSRKTNKSFLWSKNSILFLNIFGFLWGLGFLFLSFRLFYRLICLKTLRKNLTIITDSKAIQILNKEIMTFGMLPRKICICESPEVHSPVVLGFFNHLIILPRNFVKKTEYKELRSVFIHELSHIYHKDQLTWIFIKIATIFFWWNPLVYSMNHTFSRTREEISDNYVLKRNNSKEYARCLINIAEKTSLSKKQNAIIFMSSQYIPLKKRIKYILSKERKMDTNLKKSTFFIMAGLFFVFLWMIAGFKLTFAVEKEKTNLPLFNSDHSIKEPLQKDKINEEEKIRFPKLTKRVEPFYPEIAKQAQVEGLVILEVTIDKKGKVQNAKVIRSVPLLDDAAVDAVKQWIYEPFIVDGKARPVVFIETLEFRLNLTNAENVSEKDNIGGIEGFVEGAVLGGVVEGV